MPPEPAVKRAIAFIDGQNLFHAARESFGYPYPSYKVASAFPFSPTTRNRRGIEKTDWIKVDRVTYDACLDRRDYRPKSTTGSGGNP
jgi:hypothetical protein